MIFKSSKLASEANRTSSKRGKTRRQIGAKLRKSERIECGLRECKSGRQNIRIGIR